MSMTEHLFGPCLMRGCICNAQGHAAYGHCHDPGAVVNVHARTGQSYATVYKVLSDVGGAAMTRHEKHGVAYCIQALHVTIQHDLGLRPGCWSIPCRLEPLSQPE